MGIIHITPIAYYSIFFFNNVFLSSSFFLQEFVVEQSAYIIAVMTRI
jgi:hypothetical protein